MALLQALASLINKRLSAAAQEIFGSVGQMISEYENEAFSLQKDIDRQSRLLDMVLKSYIREPGWYNSMKISLSHGKVKNNVYKCDCLVWFYCPGLSSLCRLVLVNIYGCPLYTVMQLTKL